jgi:hypothetical protein
MARYHFVVAIIKGLGIYFGIMGLVGLVQMLWFTRTWTSQGHSEQVLQAMIQPVAFFLASPVLIFAAPFVARLSGERKPPT